MLFAFSVYIRFFVSSPILLTMLNGMARDTVVKYYFFDVYAAVTYQWEKKLHATSDASCPLKIENITRIIFLFQYFFSLFLIFFLIFICEIFFKRSKVVLVQAFFPNWNWINWLGPNHHLMFDLLVTYNSHLCTSFRMLAIGLMQKHYFLTLGYKTVGVLCNLPFVIQELQGR